MVTQAKQILYSPVDVDDADFINMEVDTHAEAENAEFEAFKTEMHDSQDDAKIVVGKKLTDSRGRPMGRKTFECFECGIDDYTFSQLCTRIREDFGTGLYQIQGRDSKGKFKFRKTVGIQAPNSVDNAPAGNDVGALIDKFSDALERQQLRTEQMVEKLSGPQGQVDPFTQMTQMMTAMGGMMGAMGINPQPPKTVIESLTEMKMMRELLGDLTGGNSEGGEGNIMGLLTATVQNLGPLLGAAISAGQKDGTVNPAGIVQPTAGNVLPEHINALPKPNPDNDMTIEQSAQIEAIKPQLEFLVKQAEGGAEPHDVADFVIRLVPDDKLEELETFLSTETCTDVCVLAVPEIKLHMLWFEKWLASMLSNLAIILDTSDSDENTEPLTDDKDETITDRQDGLSDVAGNDDGASLIETETVAPDPDTQQSGDTASTA